MKKYKVSHSVFESETKKTVWDSDLKVIKEVNVIVPIKILQICRSIQKKVNRNEFSILAKGRWTEKGFELSEDFVIPKQEVSSSSVDYKEPLDVYTQSGFNTVIHSHPWGGKSFSYADEESINSNFTCSILFDGSDFATAVVNIQINAHVKLQLTAKIIVDTPQLEIDTSNISEKQFVQAWN